MRRVSIWVAAVGLVIVGTSGAWTSRAQVRTPLPESTPMTKKKVLILAFANGFHHASVTNAAATLWQIGNQSGVYESEIRTDTKWITKGNPGGGESRNLDYFDAIVAVNTTGNWGLSDEQKRDFVSFIRDDGKGFVGVHAALDANRNGLFPEYTEMLGGEFAAHPWNHFPAPVIIEDHDFPATRHFSGKRLVLFDEMYMPKMETFSRSKVNVLMRLDEAKLGPPLNANVVGGPEPPPTPPSATGRGRARVELRSDRDFAITWAKTYGKGRVFYSSLGHTKESWTDPDVTKMYLEAIKWVLGLTEGSTASHAKR
jgi:type 1 glutamine amidotransferase